MKIITNKFRLFGSYIPKKFIFLIFIFSKIRNAIPKKSKKYTYFV